VHYTIRRSIKAAQLCPYRVREEEFAEKVSSVKVHLLP